MAALLITPVVFSQSLQLVDPDNNNTANWDKLISNLTWNDGGSVTAWIDGGHAQFQLGSAQTLTIKENLIVRSITQASAGTAVTINGDSGTILYLRGAESTKAVQNLSGSALTFGSSSTIWLQPYNDANTADPSKEQHWEAAADSPIVVNGVITGSSGVLNGSIVEGGFWKTGAGVLELNGNNTYSGFTVLNEGVLQAGHANAFGTSRIVFAGGTLRYRSGITTDYSGIFRALSGSSADIDTNGNDVTFTTAITGTGGLTKRGAGILTVAAGSTYNGTTTVTAGILKSGATGVNDRNAFGANNGNIVVQSGATLDVNWASANNYDAASKYNLTVSGRGVADSSGSIAGGYVGAVVSSGTHSATASPFNSITLTGDTTFAGRYLGTGARWGITNINANNHTITFVNTNGLSWNASTVQNVRDIIVEQGHLYIDSANLGDNNYSLIINSSTLGNGSTARGAVQNYYGGRTISKKITLNGGVIRTEGNSTDNINNLLTTFTLAGDLTLQANPLNRNTLNTGSSARDTLISGKIAGAGGFEWEGNTATHVNNGVTISRYSVLTLTNDQSDFTGTVRLVSGIIRLSNGTGNGGKLGAVSNEVLFAGTAPSILDLFGTSQSIGALNGTGASVSNYFIQNNRTGETSVLTLGNGNASAEFGGLIRDYGALPSGNASQAGATYTGDTAPNARMSIAKTGTGRQIFTGINTYTGGTSVSQGNLQIGAGATGQSTARAGNSAFTVTGGTLSGNGTIGYTGASNTVSAAGTLSVGTFNQTAVQSLAVEGGLTSAGTIMFDLWAVTNGTGSAVNSDSLRFVTDDVISISGILNVQNLSGVNANTWTEGTWFQLFNWSGVPTLANRQIDLSNAGSWILPTLNGSYAWDLTRLELDGRIYVISSSAESGYVFDPNAVILTASWNLSGSNMVWDDDGTLGVALTAWDNGRDAIFSNGATNSLTLTENINAKSVSQSVAGTETTIQAASGQTLTLSGTGPVVSNSSGEQLTFSSGLNVDVTGTTEKIWYAAADSDILVNATITGAVGSYDSGTGAVVGGLVKTGAGNLIFGNGTANTYSGVTRLQEGVLQAGNSQSFGTSRIVFEGGTLRYGAVVTGGYANLFAPLNYGASAILDTNGFNITLNTALTGTGGLIKKGAGTLQMANANTFAGGITVEAGILKASDTVGTNPFGPTGKTITIRSGATLDLNWRGDATTHTYSNATYSVIVEGQGVADTTGNVVGGYVGAITNSGTTNQYAVIPLPNITLTGDTTFSGRMGTNNTRWYLSNINANGHTIRFVDANGFSWRGATVTNVRDIIIDQGIVNSDSANFGDAAYTMFINANTTPNGTHVRGALHNNITSKTITKKISLNGGQIRSEGSNTSTNPTTLQFTGDMTLVSNFRFTNLLSTGHYLRDLKFTGVISGAGGLEYIGTTNSERHSVLTLTNSANTFTGTIRFGSGVIRMSDGALSGTLGNNQNELFFTTQANTAIFDLFGASQSIGALNGASGTTHFIQSNRTNTTATLTVGNGNASGSFAGILRDYGTLPLGNASASEASFINDGTAGAKLAFSKTGTGRQILTGVSTFSGGTTVSAGELQVGSGATGQSAARLGNGTFNVSGGTLSGNGTVGYAGTTSTVGTGGTLRVGTFDQTAAQHLTLEGGLDSDGNMVFDIWNVNNGSGNTSNSDYIQFTSNQVIDLSGTLTVVDRTNSSLGWEVDTWFQIFDWSGVTTEANRQVNYTAYATPALASIYEWDYSRLVSEGRMYVIYAPEPGRALLFMIGFIGMLLQRRRKA